MNLAVENKQPGLLVAFVPIVLLISLMVLNIIIFKDDAMGGPNQLALLLSAMAAAFIGIFHLKIKYKKLETVVLESIIMSMQAMLILLVVGSLISIWIMSGIVPLLIYYGLQIIHPSIFLFVACIVCVIVSLSTGSSWSTSGTIGIALIAMGKTLDIPTGMVAGAVISGAYFGDKMSPLSDTTNLAPAMVGTDLFTHIRHMVYTSGPAIILALAGFFLLGLFYQGQMATSTEIEQVLQIIRTHFNVNPWLLLVPLVVIIMVARRMPALPALMLGVLLGAVAIALFQSELLAMHSGGKIGGVYAAIISTAANGFSIETGNPMIDELFSRGGMSSMLTTIWLIICAMVFGGMLEACGMLQRIARSILNTVRGVGSLIGAVLATCIFTNMTASDQYIAIVVPARMFRAAFQKLGLHPKNLSRAVEDAGTVTSVLVPWSTGGAFHSGVLGVATLSYLPFCFFNLFSPLVSAFLAGMDWSIDRLSDD